MKKIIIFYHKDCPDGFGAAWIAWKKYGKKAEYIGINPRELPDGFSVKNAEIYLLDNSLTQGVAKDLEKNGNHVVMIDHHASPFAIKGSLSAIARAVREMGLRASLCYEVSDRDGKEIHERTLRSQSGRA